MPETAVQVQGDALFGEYEIGAPWNVRRMPPPTGDLRLSQSPNCLQLCAGVAPAPNAGHDLRPLLRRENVRHLTIISPLH